MKMHMFDIEVATELGMAAAVILQNIEFWIEKNKSNERHFYDGRYWTYNSKTAFEKLFPYLTYKQIRTALDRLREAGYIVTGNYNPDPFVKTLWYALGDARLAPEGQRRSAPEGQCYKEQLVNTDIKPNIYSPSQARDAIPYQQIVDLYHEVLKGLPRVQALTAKRRQQIAARWRNQEHLPTMENWKDYFEYVSESPFLMGKKDPSNGHARFVADLEWLTKEGNFIKVWEQKYHGI